MFICTFAFVWAGLVEVQSRSSVGVASRRVRLARLVSSLVSSRQYMSRGGVLDDLTTTVFFYHLLLLLMIILLLLIFFLNTGRRWCSGIMQDSHSCDPGSIPGRRMYFCSILVVFVIVGASSCFWYHCSAHVWDRYSCGLMGRRGRSAQVMLLASYFPWTNSQHFGVDSYIWQSSHLRYGDEWCAYMCVFV